MQLLQLANALFISSALASAVLDVRDEFQPTAGSLACFYMTNDLNWAGEGQNICAISGECSTSASD